MDTATRAVNTKENDMKAQVITPMEIFATRKKEFQYVMSRHPNALLSDLVKSRRLVHRYPNTTNQYGFIDNGSNILAVAHIDTVQQAWGDKHVNLTWKNDNNNTAHWPWPIASHPNLDDRLGVFTILYVLPLYGINVDILLCDYEERGQTTADVFAQDWQEKHIANGKQYNWIVEFDRAGDDVVTYHYTEKDWEDALEQHQFTIGQGSYSDISALEDLNACAVNIGVGYHQYHSKDAWFSLSHWSTNILRFLAFHNTHKDTHFEHEKISYSTKSYDSLYNYVYGDGKWQPTTAYSIFNSCAGCGCFINSTNRVEVDYGFGGKMTGKEYFCLSCALEWNVWAEPDFNRATMWPLSEKKPLVVTQEDIMELLIAQSYDDDMSAEEDFADQSRQYPLLPDDGEELFDGSPLYTDDDEAV